MPFSPIQLTSLIVSLLSLVVLLVLCRVRPRTKGYVVPAFLYSLHASVYYTSLVFSEVTGILPPWNGVVNFGTWSSILRLQMSISILVVGTLELLEWVVQRKTGKVW